MSASAVGICPAGRLPGRLQSVVPVSAAAGIGADGTIRKSRIGALRRDDMDRAVAAGMS